MRVAGEISLDSGPLQLHQNIQVFGGSSHISHRTFKHKDNHNLKTSISHTPQFYFLLVWQAGGLTYVMREVVSFLTESEVGWDTICSKGGGFQIVGFVPTERGTSLISKKGGTPKCLISIEVEGSEVPCRLRPRGVEVVVGFTLFLGGFSSEDKTKDFGLAALFLSAGDFLLLSVVSVRLSPIFELSNFACSDVNTGGGENSHLSSLRNACGECIGVAGGVLSLSSKGSSCIFGDGITGRKGSLSFKNTVLLFSMSKSILSSMSSMLYTFH